MFPFSIPLAVDLGTAHTRIHAAGRGLVIDEPTLVTLSVRTGAVEQVGAPAAAACGRTPRHLRSARPVQRGMVTDPVLCQSMLSRFLGRASLGRRPAPIALALPGGLTEVERRALLTAVAPLPGPPPLLLDQVLAAARGAGLPLDEPCGRAIVDLGAGLTDMAVLSLSQAVCARTLPIAGDEFDLAIATLIRDRFRLEIGPATAERIKIEVGAALPTGDALAAPVKGLCLTHGLPRQRLITEDDLRDALALPLRRILAALGELLEQAPPELSADLIDSGILLTGGSAQLRHLDRLIERRYQLPVRVAAQPRAAVALGLARHLDRLGAAR